MALWLPLPVQIKPITPVLINKRDCITTHNIYFSLVFFSLVFCNKGVDLAAKPLL